MTTLYASPTGTGDGLSLGSPGSLATVLAASRAAGDAVTIYLRGGTYTLAATLALGASDSDVTWIVYPGDAAPVFSGGVQIAGWTLHDAGAGIWKATVPAGVQSRQLYVNGTRASRASRSVPSGGLSGFSQPVAGQYLCTDATMPTFARASDLEFVFNGASRQWLQARLSVASATRNGSQTTFQMHASHAEYAAHNGQGVGWPSVPTRLENAYEFLSASTPGCWYLDHGTDTLYYVPQPGEDMATADVRFPVIEQLVTINGATNVTFRGVTFSHAGWMRPTTIGSFMPLQAGWYLDPLDGYVATGDRVLAAAVDVTRSTGVHFVKCAFRHLGADGACLGVGVTASSAEWCDFTDISGDGLRVSTFGNWNPAVEDRTSGITIESCTVSYAAVEYAGCVGIWVGYTDHTRILHCEISNLTYTGVSFGWGWNPAGFEAGYANSNEIGWCHIHHAMQLLSDGGSLYTLGYQGNAPANYTRIHDNYLHDTGAALFYADQGTNGIRYDNNVCVGPGAMSSWLFGNLAYTVEGSGNYATSGLVIYYIIGDPDPEAVVSNYMHVANATAITGTDPAAWPAGAQAIAAHVGPAVSLPGALSPDSAAVCTGTISNTDIVLQVGQYVEWIVDAGAGGAFRLERTETSAELIVLSVDGFPELNPFALGGGPHTIRLTASGEVTISNIGVFSITTSSVVDSASTSDSSACQVISPTAAAVSDSSTNTDSTTCSITIPTSVSIPFLIAASLVVAVLYDEAVADTGSTSDAIVIALNVRNADGATIVDSHAISLGVPTSDGATTLDSVGANVGQFSSVSDSSSSSDSVGCSLQLRAYAVDHATCTDSLALEFVAPNVVGVQDSASCADSNTVVMAIGQTDGATTSDAAVAVIGELSAVVDSAQCSDSVLVSTEEGTALSSSYRFRFEDRTTVLTLGDRATKLESRDRSAIFTLFDRSDDQ